MSFFMVLPLAFALFFIHQKVNAHRLSETLANMQANPSLAASTIKTYEHLALTVNLRFHSSKYGGACYDSVKDVSPPNQMVQEMLIPRDIWRAILGNKGCHTDKEERFYLDSLTLEQFEGKVHVLSWQGYSRQGRQNLSYPAYSLRDKAAIWVDTHHRLDLLPFGLERLPLLTAMALTFLLLVVFQWQKSRIRKIMACAAESN